MLKSIAHHLGANKLACFMLLVSFSTLLLISDDFLQQLYTTNNQARIESSHVLGMFGFSFGLWWTRSRWLVSVVLALFAVMQIFQLSYISYVGQPLNPIDISLISREWHEITEVAGSAWVDHWPVLLAVGIPYGMLFWLFWRYMPQYKLPGRAVATLLVLAALFSKPYWAMTHNLVQFMPGPTRSSLYNSLGAFSFYVVRLSFGRSNTPDISYPAYSLEQVPVKSPPAHLWILLGETLRGDRMSVYGYPRNNTPGLASMLREGELQALPGVAGAVSTGVSIPLFINGVVEPGNEEELQRRVGNLFRQAKKTGYHTFWLSTQESKLLNNLEPESIDTIFTKATDPLAVSNQGDRLLLGLVQKLPKNQPTFGVINMRAAHAPYENVYRQDASFQPPWLLTSQNKLNDSYDNALAYADDIITRLMRLQAQAFSGNRAFVVTADHGEMLGERGLVGHNLLTPEVASIPALLRVQWQQGLEPRLPDQPYLTHADLHAWILGQLGGRLVNPSAKPGLAYFHSVNFYADNFFVTVTPGEKGHPFFSTQRLTSESDVLLADSYHK